MKRGKGSRVLLKSEILQAQDESPSAAAAARKLGIHYNTYKKWAKKYGIFERLKNPGGTKLSGGAGIKDAAMEDILAGKHPNYDVAKLKKRLIRNGYLKEECSNCGFHEQRITDLIVPLRLNHINGNKKDHSLDNLELLCYNCWFLLVGNFWGRYRNDARR